MDTDARYMLAKMDGGRWNCSLHISVSRVKQPRWPIQIKEETFNYPLILEIASIKFLLRPGAGEERPDVYCTVESGVDNSREQ